MRIPPFSYSVKIQDHCFEDESDPVLITLSHSQVHSHFVPAGCKATLGSCPGAACKRLREACRQEQEAEHLREKLQMLLSLVPNQPAPGHPRTQTHPELPPAFQKQAPHSSLATPSLLPHSAPPTDCYGCRHKHGPVLRELFRAMSRAGASDRAGAVPGAAAARSGRTAGTRPGARDRSRGFPWGLRRAGAAGSPAGTAACGQPRQGMPLPVRRCSWPMAVPDTT